MERDSKTGRWVKGVSGNPAGRPPNRTATSVLRDHIDLDELAKALLKLIRKGELSAITYAFDRFDGKPKQATELSGELKTEQLVRYVEGPP